MFASVIKCLGGNQEGVELKFGSQFRKLSPLPFGLTAFGSVPRQHTVVGAGSAMPWLPGSERERQKEAVSHYSRLRNALS